MFYESSLIGALIVAGASVVRRDQDLNGADHDLLVAVGLIVATVSTMFLAIPAIGAFGHHTFDNYLFLADRAIGLDTLAIARTVYSYPTLMGVTIIAYVALPAIIGIAYAIQRSMTLLWAALIAAALAPFCYLLVPAIGPVFAFANFPWSNPHPAAQMMLVLSANIPRNVFPSLHFAWAMLIYINSRRWFRVPALVFLFLTAVATMGLGQHYAVDLIAAVPFTVAVQWLAERAPEMARHWKLRWSSVGLTPILNRRIFANGGDERSGPRKGSEVKGRPRALPVGSAPYRGRKLLSQEESMSHEGRR